MYVKKNRQQALNGDNIPVSSLGDQDLYLQSE